MAGVLVSAVILPRYLGTASTNCSPRVPKGWTNGQEFVLVNCGTTTTLRPNSYTSYQADRLSDGEIMLGQFSVQSSVGAYLLNTSEFSSLLTNPHPTSPPPAYFWTCGEVTVCDVQADVPPSPATYVFVLENLGATSVSVDWTETLLIYYTPTPAA